MNTQVMKRVLVLPASKAEVWDALTNPQKTKIYMFNCEAHSTWEKGSPIEWKGNYQGYESAERGIILEVEKEKHLKFTSFDPNFGLEDIPENHITMEYVLEEEMGKTKLITIIENFNGDEKRIDTIAQGWDDEVVPAFKAMFE